MRLAYISGSTIPSESANSVHVMKMCAALARCDVQVTLMGKGSGQNAFTHYGVDQNFMLHTSPIKPLIHGAQRLWQAVTHTLRAQPDIAYGRDIIALAYIAQQIPTMAELHHMPSGLARIALRQLITAPHFKGLVVISNALRNDVLNHYPKLMPEDIITLPDAADPVPAGITPVQLKGAFKVGYTGSLLQGKGVELIPQMAAQCPDIEFHIIGGKLGHYDPMRRLAITAGMQNITFHGHVPASEIPAYQAAFDVALAPYQNHMPIRNGIDISRWLSPLKLFEYMAAGTPIIASALPILKEVLKDGENAKLVSPCDDVQSWIAAIKYLKDQPEIARQLAENAREDFKANYTWDKRAQKLIHAMRAKVNPIAS